MPYLGTQPNNVKQNTGLYTPSEILELTKDGSWGGSSNFIAEQTLSGAVSYNFTSIKENVYDVHYLQIENSGNVTDNRRLTCRLYESGVLETASVYQIATQTGTGAGSFVEVNSTGIDEMRLCDNTGGNSTGEKANSYAYFYNLGNSSKYSFMTFHSVVGNNAGSVSMEFGGGVLPQASTVDGIRVLINDETNFSSFTMKLYGMKQI